MSWLGRLLRLGYQGEKGQGMVEFILVTPLFLMLFFVIVGFTLGLRDWIAITNATREGARLGALGHSVGPDQIKQRVLDATNGLVSPDEVVVEYKDGPDAPPTDGICDAGDSVIVKVVDHPYGFTAPLLPPIELRLSSSTDMKLELPVKNSCSGG